MFRCFSLLGIVAVAFGVAALASVTPSTQKIVLKTRPRRVPARLSLNRIPGLQYHMAFSMN